MTIELCTWGMPEQWVTVTCLHVIDDIEYRIYGNMNNDWLAIWTWCRPEQWITIARILDAKRHLYDAFLVCRAQNHQPTCMHTHAHYTHKHTACNTQFCPSGMLSSAVLGQFAMCLANMLSPPFRPLSYPNPHTNTLPHAQAPTLPHMHTPALILTDHSRHRHHGLHGLCSVPHAVWPCIM